MKVLHGQRRGLDRQQRDPARVMMRQIAGAFHEYERARLVAKMKAGRDAYARHWLCIPGPSARFHPQPSCLDLEGSPECGCARVNMELRWLHVVDLHKFAVKQIEGLHRNDAM
jgi:hypothetical protein